jgi:hypothetical protein
MCCQMNLVSRQICTAGPGTGSGRIAMTLPADPCPPAGPRPRPIPHRPAAAPHPPARPGTRPRALSCPNTRPRALSRPGAPPPRGRTRRAARRNVSVALNES